jgi:CDP-diacylglycerol--glycerol-3-phosphate 3-phosphatidyltransferase/cardiolipin synthase
VARIALVPTWVVLAELFRSGVVANAPDPTLRHAALGLLLALGVSDVVDGWIARKFDLTTNFGATLDAVADKLAQVFLYTFLALRGAPAFPAVPLWFIGILILRDVLLTTGWFVVRGRVGKVDARHRLVGKVSSFLMFAILVWITADLPATHLLWAFAVAATLSVVTTALYIRDGVEQMRAGA